ncbi:winged helix-turn-helix transcriptional regulator [Mucilaginibacter jinjuensis]|uniref:Helix-turn-helix domain-containing protein n=1 Tax=Mucilaginibacter jinjuensis TaxID=1176721 RepID=A0ABY7T3M4_9SPHI|nr:helix-turn-helix domain-containing protein [Mucilaginibacter jinjuensis]WCT11055.1 helix-turn-helix domain-containing protein [Mucilaginibacter jinjuensis]
MEPHRSYCPVNLAIEVIGDKWSLLILRDMIFYKRRHFNELLRQSEEKIASNILRDRLAMFEKEGLVTKGKGPDDIHKQKVTYSLTEKSIDLLPVLVSAIGWSIKYEPVNMQKYKPAIDLFAAGQAGIEGFQKLLREEHLTADVVQA